MKKLKIITFFSFFFLSFLCFSSISSCAREFPINPDKLGERLGEARVKVKRNFFKPEFTLFPELASAFPEHEIREIRVETPEGVKVFKYEYISPEMIRAMDVDEPVTEYSEGAGIFEGDIIFDIRTQEFGPGYSYRPEEMPDDERRREEERLREEARAREEGRMSEEERKLREEKRDYEELRKREEERRRPEELPGGAGITGWIRLWPKREVPFVIAPVAEKNNLFDIMDAITMWAKAGIKFRHRQPKDGNKYIYFMKTSGLYQGSSDSIGMRSDNQPTTIKIGYGCGAGLIAHEIGHALGLFHEQSRLDRDKYVVIKWDNIKDDKKHNYCKYNGTGHKTHCTMPDRSGQDMGLYEYSSIMHYGSYYFGKIDGGKVFAGGILCSLFPFNPDCYTMTYYGNCMGLK